VTRDSRGGSQQYSTLTKRTSFIFNGEKECIEGKKEGCNLYERDNNH